MMESCYNFLDENIAEINEKINNACKIANKSSKDITLLAVTKTVDEKVIEAVIKKGLYEIGENKVQEMLQKCDYLSATPHKTHIIGHLQTNKVKFLPDKVQMIQSVDSEKLVDEIEKCYGAENKICEVLVEVNIGDEIAKTGINKNDAESLCYYIAQRQHLALKGLMCIPPNCEGDMVRKYFEKMYAMFVDIRAKKLDNSNIDTLSMGMSGDFDLAIMEGATMVRVGTSLFGKRNYN